MQHLMAREDAFQSEVLKTVSCGWLRKEEGCEGEGLVQVAEEAGGIQLGVKRLRSYTTAVCEYCVWAFDNNKRQ